MAGKDSQDSEEKLRQQIARLQAKLRRKQAAQKTQERRNDTRRKVIIGSHALQHMETNKDSQFTKTLWPILDEYVVRPQDRELLNEYFQTVGLKELPPHKKNSANDDSAATTALKPKFQK